VRVFAALAAGVAAASAVWGVALGAFLVVLFEPWPLALRRGPDTAFSRSCYAEVLGGVPPADVTRIYCRKASRFGSDTIDTIRFGFRANVTIEAIVRRLELVAVPEAERGRVRYLNGPRWWPPESRLGRVRDVYDRGGVGFFWVDAEANEAFFQQRTVIDDRGRRR
jgi:hypothetical protein